MSVSGCAFATTVDAVDDEAMLVPHFTPRNPTPGAFVVVMSTALFFVHVTVWAQDTSPYGAQSRDDEVFTILEPSIAEDPTDRSLRFLGLDWDTLSAPAGMNFDLISRIETTRRRGKPFALNAIGIDLRKVVSSEHLQLSGKLITDRKPESPRRRPGTRRNTP